MSVPILGFIAVLGFGRLGTKQVVMAVETVHHGLRDVIGQGGVESLRIHGCDLSGDLSRVALKSVAKHIDHFC